MDDGVGTSNSQSNETGSASRSYSDLILAFGVVVIVSLMILPLPLFVVDVLVAVNILLAISLVLMAIYIPSPTAFSSFPSVILLSTLFRLSLSIAITRLILLDADAGHIIETFGNLVVGGNIVVGIVVFIIITVVQFIVIAKGTERVAEVSARFTLDAMPGKQLSIDSDLRAGLIDKDETRRRRRMLELESQLHGALDGAMKFVKGDAIAGIIILIVNILGGLAIGVLQRDMTLGDAVHTYSILTIGDGLVSQIPALLTSISAGLIITRTTGSDEKGHLGNAMGKQLSSHPRVLMIGGFLSFLLTLVPGFPWPVFLILGLVLLAIYYFKNSPVLKFTQLIGMGESRSKKLSTASDGYRQADELPLPVPVVLTIDAGINKQLSEIRIKECVEVAVKEIREEFGVPVPMPAIKVNDTTLTTNYHFEAYGVRIASGVLKFDHEFLFELSDSKELINQEKSESSLEQFIPPMVGHWKAFSGDLTVGMLQPEKVLQRHLKMSLIRQLSLFLGIQETSDLVTRWNQDYPDLIKEMLRVVTPQRLTDVLRRLLQEGYPIRNLRDIFEAITDIGSREKDLISLTEQVRVAMRRQTSERVAGPQRFLRVLLLHPELEETLRQTIIESSAGNNQPVIEPQLIQNIQLSLKDTFSQVNWNWTGCALLCSIDIRRHVRGLLEDDFFELPVLSFQELTKDIQVEPLAQISG